MQSILFFMWLWDVLYTGTQRETVEEVQSTACREDVNNQLMMEKLEEEHLPAQPQRPGCVSTVHKTCAISFCEFVFLCL